MNSPLPEFKILLTGGRNALIEIDSEERSYFAAVSKDDPPTTAFILYTPLEFPNRLKASLRERLKRHNIQVINQIEISSDTLNSIYEKFDSIERPDVKDDLDYERYCDNVRALLVRAVDAKASDIHIVRRLGSANVSFRVNGEISEHSEWTAEQADRICRFIYEVMGHDQEVTWNRNEPQDAVLETVLPNRHRIRVRVGTIPASPDGYDMVLRILPGYGEVMKLDELGYELAQIRMIRTMVNRASGLVVMAGSVGSGKSTSIVSMLNEEFEIHRGNLRIITVEDPPERIIKGASQVPVVRKRGIASGDEFSFAIRGALRCDPDTLMVGEIRDLQSAVLTIKFAQSGHRVYTTVHAATALGIVGRLSGIGVDPVTLCTPDVLYSLIHQSLIPLLCSNCKLTVDQWTNGNRAVSEQTNLLNRTLQLFRSRGLEVSNLSFRGPGCQQCKNTGVTGRTVIAEIVIPDEQLLEYLRCGEYTSARNYWISRLNGQPFAEHAINLMMRGKVAPSDVEPKIGSLELHTVSPTQAVTQIQSIRKNRNFA